MLIRGQKSPPNDGKSKRRRQHHFLQELRRQNRHTEKQPQEITPRRSSLSIRGEKVVLLVALKGVKLSLVLEKKEKKSYRRENQ